MSYGITTLSNGVKINEKHLKEWVEGSGVSEAIALANIESITKEEANRRVQPKHPIKTGGWWCRGVNWRNGQPMGNRYGQLKPDKPHHDPEKKKPAKYLTASGVGVDAIFLKVPGDTLYWYRVYKNKDIRIIYTEGCKKAGCGLTNDYATIALTGVWNWGKDGELAPQVEEWVKRGGEQLLALDSDYRINPSCKEAIKRFCELTEKHGTGLKIVTWDSQWKGMDDFIKANGKDAFEERVKQAQTLKEWLKQLDEEKRDIDEDIPTNLTPLTVQYEKARLVIGDRIRFNEITKDIELDGKPFNIDRAELELSLKFNLSLKVTVKNLEAIVATIAEENSYNPVKEYLMECHRKNPDTSILDGLAKRYFEVDNPLYEVFLRKILIAAVARIFEPGCKHDNTLILQSSKQGIGKSTFFAILGGKYFCDDMGDFNSKDEKLKMHQSWIVEWSELERVTRGKEAEQIKNFLSCKEDNIRPPYGRKTEQMPRCSTIVGTTNQTEILKDDTGDRRYWVIRVECNKIPVELLKQERDLIWGAAVAAYLSGEKWHLDDDEQEASNKNNAVHRVVSPYEDDIADYLEGKDKVWTEELIGVMRINDSTLKEVNTAHNEIKRIMTRLGWEKADQVVKGDKRKRGYKRPTKTYTALGSRVEGCVSQNPCTEGDYTATQPTHQNPKLFTETESDALEPTEPVDSDEPVNNEVDPGTQALDCDGEPILEGDEVYLTDGGLFKDPAAYGKVTKIYPKPKFDGVEVTWIDGNRTGISVVYPDQLRRRKIN